METPKNRNWKVLKSEYLSRQPWFTVRREEVELRTETGFLNILYSNIQNGSM